MTNRAELYANDCATLKTPFWKKAAASLPASARARHIGAIEQAERFELALDGAFELMARVKAAFGSAFQRPRTAH
ncbi:MAG TPA: hypothetical protein VM183_04080 [Burkholderiales bacterium]|nr:hypothetical protein [Burkholderiales bacterium]